MFSVLVGRGRFAVGRQRIAHFIIEDAWIGNQHPAACAEQKRQPAQMAVPAAPGAGIESEVIGTGLEG